MKFRSLLLASLFIIAQAAMADAPAGGPPPGAPPYGGMPKIMFRQGGIGTLGQASDLPTVGIAYLPVDHMMVSAAVGLTYNGNGLLVPDGMGGQQVDLTERWQSSVLVAAEYMIHDVYPFAMGPQFMAMTTLTPGRAFDTVILSPAWGFWYAPFNAPVGIGSALGLKILLNKGAEPIVSLFTPGVRLVYVFN